MLKVSFIIVAALMAITSAKQLGYTPCCGNWKIMNDVGPKCPLNATSDGGQKEQFDAFKCQVNCVARELNIIEGNSVSLVKFNQMIEETVTDNELQEMFKTTLKKCVETVEEKSKHHKHHDHDDSKCPNEVFGVLLCFAKQIHLGCPDASKIQSDACQAQQQYFERMPEKYKH